MRNYYITPIKNYPDNGKHLECHIPLPFDIKRGEDGYYYRDHKGVERKYNLYKDDRKIDDRWIVHIDGDALGVTESLIRIFHIMVDKDLDKIVDYCLDIYERSLKLEQERLKRIKLDFGIAPVQKRIKVVGVIALNTEDFLQWKLAKKHRPTRKARNTQRDYTYRGKRYICFTRKTHCCGCTLDEIVETQRAYMNPEYNEIWESARPALITKTYGKEEAETGV